MITFLILEVRRTSRTPAAGGVAGQRHPPAVEGGDPDLRDLVDVERGVVGRGEDAGCLPPEVTERGPQHRDDAGAVEPVEPEDVGPQAQHGSRRADVVGAQVHYPSPAAHVHPPLPVVVGSAGVVK